MMQKTQKHKRLKTSKENIAATITTHHLVINRNFILAGGIKPHYYCLPVAKRERHRVALLKAATSGNSSFFLGTDSAPHFDSQKESSCGCAGCFTTPNTLPILAHLFEQKDLLKNLEKFTSINGAKFYNLPTFWLLTLPFASALFLAMTWTSAIRYWRGERTRWKERSYRNL